MHQHSCWQVKTTAACNMLAYLADAAAYYSTTVGGSVAAIDCLCTSSYRLSDCLATPPVTMVASVLRAVR
jgi:hypothetical protein